MRNTNKIHLSYRITVIAINFPHDNVAIDNNTKRTKKRQEIEIFPNNSLHNEWF